MSTVTDSKIIELKELLNIINILVKPEGLENCSTIEEGLKCSIKQIITHHKAYSVDNILSETTFENISWKFVQTCLFFLTKLKYNLLENPEEMLSISQQNSIKFCLEKVIGLELLPHLLPGVGLGLSTITSHSHLMPQNKLSDIEKYEHLCFVVDNLVSLHCVNQLHNLMYSSFMGHLYSALCQLSLFPFKKPQEGDCDKTNGNYEKLIANKIKYANILNSLLSVSYQPQVIKELMFILGNKKKPTWLERGIIKLLNKRLVQQGGVLATVRVFSDACNNSDLAPKVLQIEAISKLISNPHCKGIERDDFYKLVSPQILSLLDSKDPNMIRIAVTCCQKLDPDIFQLYIFREITKPLFDVPVNEHNVTFCIQRLHKGFAIPASDLWCLSVDFITPIVKFLFHLYSKIYVSVSHIKTLVEDLVWCILTKNEDEKLKQILKSVIFDIDDSDFRKLPRDIEFIFGDEGGVQIVNESNKHSLEDYGDAVLFILELRDHSGIIGNKLFALLLELSTESEHKDSLERYIVTIKLLTLLSEKPKVQKAISKHPTHVIMFIKSFIELKLDSCNEELDSIGIALMVLSAVLVENIHSKKVDWDQFNDLIIPITALRDKTTNVEIRSTAEKLVTLICTRGLSKKINNDECKKEEITCNDGFEQAMIDACDTLLPVRSHGMMRLASLIKAGDKETLAHKEAVLCVFQENMNHKDSYLYLSAIEGLSTLAAEFPDTVLLSLIRNYSRVDIEDSESRLKIGECLMRVTRLLGELVPTYKSELLNVFLAGTRDHDALVRASSLANLGEICRILGFRIGNIAAEILHCVHCIVQTDKAIEPRRAAVMVVTMLLKGMEKDAFNVLQNHLKELYSSLKHVYNTDKDDQTRLHAQLALEELNTITRAFLFPSQVLSKRIFVLDAPP
uniref:RNA polymerase II assembly factor Rtp1 C-terminal domain-containing protein n=2 Tax=Clastoptera arizonana TaxID=38151 RepID=A0A1B6DUB8_9HEMI